MNDRNKLKGKNAHEDKYINVIICKHQMCSKLFSNWLYCTAENEL